MKRKKQHPNRFIRFIYFCLVIFIVESAVYFSKSLFNPSPTFAQTQIEPTLSAVPESPSPAPNYTPNLPILIYHYVEYVTDERDTIRKSLNITPNIFEAQMKTLKDTGYTFVTPSQISEIESGKSKIEKPIIVSFDDGYGDFYTDVFPILKRNNIKAVAYIIPGFLQKPNYMTWDQIKEISSSSLVEIGAHTMNHASLKNLTNEVAYKEINDSKIVLELTLGQKITTFAYPYGHFNNQTPSLVESAGFTSAVTTVSGTNVTDSNEFTLKRIHPGMRTNQDLIEALD